MSRFVVTRVLAIFLLAGLALPAAESRWLQVRAPEFVLVTQMPEKQATAWAGEFSQFIAALKTLLPINTARLSPLTVVIFARERDFRGFRPLDPAGRPKEMSGYFTHREGWAVAGLAGDDLSRTRRTIFHEGTHWFMSGFDAPNPVWFEEGIAEVFSTFELERKNMVWGRPIEGHVRALNVLPPPPLEKLLYLARGDLFAEGSEGMERTGLAYAQSWAFVHYLIFGAREGSRREALVNYVIGVQGGKHPDEAFRAAFGVDYAEMDSRLREYLRFGRYYTAKVPAAPLPELRAEPAAAIDVETALAKLCLAAFRHAEALEHAKKVLALAGEGPAGHELLGEIHREKGDQAEARAAFAQAIARGSRSFRPYFELAAARHAEVSTPGGAVQGLSAEQAREVADNYERAINFRPQFKRAYHGLAGIIGLVPPGNAQDVKFLEQGLALFPGDPSIRIGLAVVAKRDGDDAKARAMLDEVLANSDQLPAQARSYARRLDSAWQRNEDSRRVSQLVQERKYAEALAVVTRSMEETNNAAERVRLHNLRKNLEATMQAEAIREAWDARNWSEARRLLGAFLESDAPPLMKTPMRRRLEELDRRGLGKE